MEIDSVRAAPEDAGELQSAEAPRSMAPHRRWIRAFQILLFIAIFARLLLAIHAPTKQGYYYDDAWPALEIVHNESRAPGPRECWQCYNPPLHFALSSAFIKLAERCHLPPPLPDWAPLALNLIMSLALIAMTAGLLRILRFSTTSPFFWGALAVGALIPKSFVMSASFNLDVPANFWIVASLLFVSALWEAKGGLWSALGLGVCLALGLMSRYTVAVAVIACAQLLFLALLKGRTHLRRLMHLTVAIGLGISLCSPVYLANLERTEKLLPGNVGNDGLFALEGEIGEVAGLLGFDFPGLVTYPYAKRVKRRLDRKEIYEQPLTGLYGMMWSDLGFFSTPGVSPFHSFPEKKIPPALVTLILLCAAPVLLLAFVGLSLRRAWSNPAAPLFGINLLAFALIYRLGGGVWHLKYTYILGFMAPFSVALAAAGERLGARGGRWARIICGLLLFQGSLCATYALLFATQ